MLYILNCMMLHVSSISIKQKQKLSDLRCSRNLLGKIKKIVIKTDPDMKLEEKDFTISMITMFKCLSVKMYIMSEEVRNVWESYQNSKSKWKTY